MALGEVTIIDRWNIKNMGSENGKVRVRANILSTILVYTIFDNKYTNNTKLYTKVRKRWTSNSRYLIGSLECGSRGGTVLSMVQRKLKVVEVRCLSFVFNALRFFDRTIDLRLWLGGRERARRTTPWVRPVSSWPSSIKYWRESPE